MLLCYENKNLPPKSFDKIITREPLLIGLHNFLLNRIIGRRFPLG